MIYSSANLTRFIVCPSAPKERVTLFGDNARWHAAHGVPRAAGMSEHME